MCFREKLVWISKMVFRGLAIAMLLFETTSCPFLRQLSRVGPIVINQKTRGKTAVRRGFPRGSTLGHSNILDSALLCSLDKNWKQCGSTRYFKLTLFLLRNLFIINLDSLQSPRLTKQFNLNCVNFSGYHWWIWFSCY